MNTSDTSASSAVNLTTQQLRSLFWHNQIMDKFRNGKGIDFVIDGGITPSPAEFSRWFFTDEPIEQRVNRRSYLFSFQAHELGDETWVAVICDGRVIIPPFPFPAGGRGATPYFPEEVGGCSTFR